MKTRYLCYEKPERSFDIVQHFWECFTNGSKTRIIRDFKLIEVTKPVYPKMKNQPPLGIHDHESSPIIFRNRERSNLSSCHVNIQPKPMFQ